MPEAAPAGPAVAGGPPGRHDGVARAWIEVDLDALARNFDRIAALVAPARVLPVLKADAYGHGAVEVARTLSPRGAAGFAVARLAEGVALRDAGVEERILVFAPTRGAELPLLAHHELTPVVSDLDQLAELERFAASSGWRPRVHLKLDSGMHRLGVPLVRASEAFDRLRASAHLEWEGLLSHLAAAEDEDDAATAAQVAAFEAVIAALPGEERARLELHLGNGAAAQLRPRTRLDLVRPGLALHGGALPGSPLELEPVLSLRAELLQVKPLAIGERVGYGGRFTARRPTRLGIVGVGYADGYPWRIGAEGRGEALVHGVRVPLLGTVSMDLLAVDLTDSGGEVGEEVVLVGRQGSEAIRIEELAERAGTLPYEIVCGLRLRLPRRTVGGVASRAVERRP